jgi:hypothetical protein
MSHDAIQIAGRERSTNGDTDAAVIVSRRPRGGPRDVVKLAVRVQDNGQRLGRKAVHGLSDTGVLTLEDERHPVADALLRTSLVQNTEMACGPLDIRVVHGRFAPPPTKQLCDAFVIRTQLRSLFHRTDRDIAVSALVRDLSERGHDVIVSCELAERLQLPAGLAVRQLEAAHLRGKEKPLLVAALQLA